MLKCNQRRAIRNCRSSLLQMSSNVEAEHASYVQERRSAGFCETAQGKMRIGNCITASNIRIQLSAIEMEHTQAYVHQVVHIPHSRGASRLYEIRSKEKRMGQQHL